MPVWPPDWGRLSGSLHGGANAKVMQMLLALENETDIEGWVEGQMQQGQVIMGMGHAIYKTGDPRACISRRWGSGWASRPAANGSNFGENRGNSLGRLCPSGQDHHPAQCRFQQAPVYYLMGIPMDLMTPMFAISRVAGWCAHIIEEQFADVQGKPALYRPQAQYVGEYCGLMGCEYAPPDKR
jgi:citrate synthase